MNSAYRHLALPDVKPGMVLSDVLRDKHGQVLLPAGAVLSAAIIALLPRHGIDVLTVLREHDATALQSAPDLPALQARLAHLFRKNDPDNEHDQATSSLRRYLQDYRSGAVAP